MRTRITIAALCALFAALIFPLAERSVSAWSSTCDFVTGGGFIVNPTPAGGKGTFGVGGGCKHGGFWGHLEYQDHALGKKIHWTSITGYQKDPSDKNARLICGTGRTPTDNNVSFVVRVKDKGEPGSYDQFDIQWDGTNDHYSTFLVGFPHTLGGGNIQLHKPNNSNDGDFGGTCPPIGPNPPPTPQEANVTVLKTTTTPAPRFNTTVSYDIQVQNIGTAGATNVVVTDHLPTGNEGTITWTVTSPAPPVCQISTLDQTLTCTFATLAANASATIHVQATLGVHDCLSLDDPPGTPTMLTNVASVTSDGQGELMSDPAVILLPPCPE
jgi:uncharacterized repeat protein (TIGR01451 family)